MTAYLFKQLSLERRIEQTVLTFLQYLSCQDILQADATQGL